MSETGVDHGDVTTHCENLKHKVVSSKNQTNNFSGDGNWLHM